MQAQRLRQDELGLPSQKLQSVPLVDSGTPVSQKLSPVDSGTADCSPGESSEQPELGARGESPELHWEWGGMPHEEGSTHVCSLHPEEEPSPSGRGEEVKHEPSVTGSWWGALFGGTPKAAEAEAAAVEAAEAEAAPAEVSATEEASAPARAPTMGGACVMVRALYRPASLFALFSPNCPSCLGKGLCRRSGILQGAGTRYPTARL